MDQRQQRAACTQAFEARKPSADGEADAYLEFDSIQPFAPSATGNLTVRLALTSDETLDLSTNPVCAARLAVALLDLLAKSGDLIIDLAIYDPPTGDQIVRITPAAQTAFRSEP